MATWWYSFINASSYRDRQKLMMMLHFTGSLINYSSRTAMALCMPHMAQQFSWDKKQQVTMADL